MKTRILLLLLVVWGSFSAMAYEPADNAGLSLKEQRRTLRGYKWNVDAGMLFRIEDHWDLYWDMDKDKVVGAIPLSNRFSVSTTHGYQFNNYFFLGGGIAFHCLTDEQEFSMPIFVALKVNILNRRVTPYVETRFGISPVNYVGVFWPSMLGLRIAIDDKTALLFAAEYSILEVAGDSFSSGLGIRIGYEF